MKCSAVPDVPEADEPPIREEPVLDRALVVDAEPLLPVDDLGRIASCVVRRSGDGVPRPSVELVQASHGGGVEEETPAHPLAPGLGRDADGGSGHGSALQ
jgi:hypothetical protein